ncbi:MAG: DUF5684 domain-containing protein [Candidatus Saccharimonadales bacterium]
MSLLTQLAQSYTYTTTETTNSVDSGTALAIAGTLMVVYVIVLILAYVVHSFLLSRIFKKAGVAPSKAWIPVYNIWIMLELGDQKGYWSVLMFVPIVNIVALVFYVIAEHNIGLKFGKEGWFVLFAIFLPLVWLIWLAVDDSKWNQNLAANPMQPPVYQPPTNIPPTPPAAV